MEKRNQKILILALFLGLNCLLSERLISQSCYVRLFDASGVEPTQFQITALETAACRLRDSLPTAFQNQFKVYDFGFYLHNENMIGGYPEMFQAAITQVETQSQYYLLFGKQTDKSGIYTKFWYALKMPTTAQFSCMTALQREVYKKRVEAKTNEKYAANQNAYFTYHEAEIAGIQELMKIIAEIKECCVANRNGVAERSAGCDGCSDEVASQFFQLQGFEKVNLNISTAAFANINTAKIKDYSFHKVTVGGQTDYLGEIMDGQVEEYNQWFSVNLLVTSYPSLCIDSISGSNLDAFKYKEDFNCQINFPSGEGLKPSDIKITWNQKAGSWIKDASTANLIASLLRCKINRFLGVSSEDCFNILSIPPWTANMNDMPEFDFFYAVYLHSLNSGVSIFDLIEGYKDFGGEGTGTDPGYVIIQNGITVVSTSVAQTVATTGTLIGFSRRNPPNVEDMQHGTNGDCSGIMFNCMTNTGGMANHTLTDEDLKTQMRNLMTFFSLDPIEDIAVSFAERFFSKISSDHYATDLSDHVRWNPVMLNYMTGFGAQLNKVLKNNNGNIHLSEALNLGDKPPHFTGWENRWRGYTITMNNTETAEIWYMGNFNLDNSTKVWSADFYFEVTDHFGLDKHDAILYQGYHTGFAAWWALQHKRNYPPFRTKITLFATLKGQL
jgi:hypothetical protein